MALINIAGKSYELVLENKAGWNLEAFKGRYSEVLERYDFIVGDWGYNQLRLKGFFREGSNKATKDSTFSFATDYINEYCNFGCAYFILEKKSDNTEQSQDGDYSATDEYDDIDFIESAQVSQASHLPVLTEDEEQSKEEVEQKPVKVQASQPNQQKHQEKQAHAKAQDKHPRRRPFKQRHNKHNQNNSANQGSKEANGQNDVAKDKDTQKKNKRRHNRPFKNYDRNKNREQVSSVSGKE